MQKKSSLLVEVTNKFLPKYSFHLLFHNLSNDIGKHEISGVQQKILIN